MAQVLRPTTKAVDVASMLAHALTPEQMRPGWTETLHMSYSALPFQELSNIDERMSNAAARPVIMPETIVMDHGSVYVSRAFQNACRTLGITIQPAHQDTPTDKPHIERTLQSVGTLFAQHVRGYLGSSVERRGKNAEQAAAFSIVELQHSPRRMDRDRLAKPSPPRPARPPRHADRIDPERDVRRDGRRRRLCPSALECR
ncbi:hypothetical protein GCM10028815_24250 [Mariniluteicoccus flavus]